MSAQPGYPIIPSRAVYRLVPWRAAHWVGRYDGSITRIDFGHITDAVYAEIIAGRTTLELFQRLGIRGWRQL